MSRALRSGVNSKVSPTLKSMRTATQRLTLKERLTGYVTLKPVSEPNTHAQSLPSQLPFKQLISACMNYRHDFGLLNEDDQARVSYQCQCWWRAIHKAIKLKDSA